MTEFLRAIGLGSKSQDKEIELALKKLDREKTPLLMEIEGSHVHFRSVLAVKQDMIIVAKPGGLGQHLKKDSVVRFSIPEEPEKDLRLTVMNAHFNLTSGNAVFICKAPHSFTEGSKRKATRFNTSRFNNLHLSIPSLSYRFRIVDLSIGGLKIYVQEKIMERFPIGKPIAPVTIQISKHSADIGSVVPRVHSGNTVGCEIQITANDTARKYISHLINSLQKTEQDKLQSAEL